MHEDYPEPVVALLSYGDPGNLANPDDPDGWPDYVKELGLSLEDAPLLIRMLDDPALNYANPEDPRIWAGIHAWRALGQLDAVEAIPDLLRCLDYDDEEEVLDWNMEEIPKVLGRIGAPAIEPLSRYLKDDTKGLWTLVAAAEGLVCIAQANPEFRQDCITAITHRLERHVENDETLNGLIMGNLMELKAVESLEAIRDAFQAGAVDISIGGDLEDVEIELGVRQARSTPRPHYHVCGTHCHTEEDDEEEEEWDRALSQFEPAPKTGRNDPCPCGSGKKYKKCCLV